MIVVREEIKKIASLLVKNFSSDKIKIFIFGDMACSLNFANECVLQRVRNLSFLIEIDPSIFKEYRHKHSKEFLNFGNDNLLDLQEFRWECYCPVKIRLKVVKEMLGADRSLIEEINQILGERSISIAILPFGWQKDKKIIEYLCKSNPGLYLNINRACKSSDRI